MINRFWDWTDSAIDWIFDRLGVHDIEDTSDFKEEDRPADGSLPLKVKEAMRDVKEMRQDRDAHNLFVGKIINDGAIRCEVISCASDNFRIKILEINWDRLGTYMDVGKIYPLLPTCIINNEMMVWEIDPETMKRDTSQVLLAWEKDIGWSWDLDM